MELSIDKMVPFEGRQEGAPLRVYCMAKNPDLLLMRALDIARVGPGSTTPSLNAVLSAGLKASFRGFTSAAFEINGGV